MRFSWIQAEWGSDYIRGAKSTILTLVRLHYSAILLSHDSQMRQYRKQKPSKPEATTTASPLRRNVPATRLAPTRFKIQDSVYKNKPTRDTGGVEAEFQRYVSGPTTSEETSILQFWEVR
jgi:hypothetical protein